MTASPLNGATISHYRVLKPLGAGGIAAVVLVSAAVALGLYKLGILSGADSAVTFSPDGKRFAFLRSSGTKESALIVSVRMAQASRNSPRPMRPIQPRELF